MRSDVQETQGMPDFVARRWMFVVALVVAAIALIGLEWAISAARRAAFLRTQQAVEKLTGVPYDARSIPEVVTDLWKADSSAVPSIVPKVIADFAQPGTDPRSRFVADIFPLAGVSGRRTVQLCNEQGAYPIYRSDQHGFLNPPDAWNPAPGRLVVIGDSFTHGYCGPADSTFPSALRRRWPSTLNLGIGGDGPLAELATLTEFGIPAEPSVVLWVYYENDLPDLRRERADPVLIRYLEPAFTQHLWQRQAAVDSVLDPWIRQVYGRGMGPRYFAEYGARDVLKLTAIRGFIRRARQGKPPGTGDQLELFKQVLGAARDRVDAHTARLVMVFLPEWERLFAPAAMVDDENRAGVLGAANALGVPVIDLAPVFATHPDRASLFGRRDIGSSHYSSAGYQVVAATIERSLDSLGLTAKLSSKITATPHAGR